MYLHTAARVENMDIVFLGNVKDGFTIICFIFFLVNL